MDNLGIILLYPANYHGTNRYMDFEKHTIPAVSLGDTIPAAELRPCAGESAWHLEIPPGPAGSYRLAQLDDYTPLTRTHFPHRPPVTLQLRARVSKPQIPGTWGFGLWNDPFSLSLGLGGGTRRFPALPNAAWFFGASPQNYLSFRDDKPARGFIAQTFRSANLPAPLLALSAPLLPLLLWPRLARAIRPHFRHWIQEDSFLLFSAQTSQVSETWEVYDPSAWHAYTLDWTVEQVSFTVDEQTFESGISPKGPLGLVIWVDNQFAAFPPDGKLSYGTLANSQSAWLEIEDLHLL